jgi:hypothetical protein
MWEKCALDNYIFGYGKQTQLAASCKLGFPTVGLKIFKNFQVVFGN